MEMVSNKEEIYEDPGLDKYRSLSWGERMDWMDRFYGGFSVACHVLAYLSGKEGRHGDYYSAERKRCANMLSRSIAGVEIYPEVHDDLEPKDYSEKSGVKGRPVLTNNILREAARRFPLRGYLIGGLPFDGAAELFEPLIKKKEVLAEFLCHLNEKNKFLRESPLWSSPVAGFLYDHSLPDDFMRDLRKKKMIAASEEVIGVLADWKNLAEGIIFTDKAIYMASPKNMVSKKFTVRYSGIKQLEYKSSGLLIRAADGNAYGILTPLWSKRNIHDFLQFARGSSEFDEKNKEMLLQIRLHTADGNSVAAVLSGEADGKLRGVTVSDKEQPYISDEILELHKKISDPEERKLLRTRAVNGFYAVCHALAFLSGKEGKFQKTWDCDIKVCANVVAHMLGFPKIYAEAAGDNLTITDFSVSASRTGPIITKDVFAEAWNRFPVETVVRLEWYEPGEERYVSKEETCENGSSA